MDSEEKLYQVLTRPTLAEMIKIMSKFHNSYEYLEGRKIDAAEASAKVLRKHGWGYNEFCIAIGTMKKTR